MAFVEEALPDSRPLPNIWARSDQKTQQQQSASLTDGEHRLQFAYISAGGDRKLVDVPQRPGPLCCLMCLPCCYGHPCSAEKKKEYRYCTMSVCFFVSLAQVVMFLVSIGMGGIVPLSENPMIGPGAQTLITLGAKDGPLMYYNDQVWRFITPIFLHAGFVHIFFNLFAQLRFGLFLERRWGWWRFIVLYFASGVGGVLLSCLARPNAISVGASGAIMGLMGGHAMEVICLWAQIAPLERRCALGQCLLFIVITMIISAAPLVDAAAHGGGVICGALVGLGFFARRSSWSKTLQLATTVLSWLLLAAFFVVGFSCFYLLPL